MKYNKFRKKRYLCKSKVSEHQTNRTMKPTAKKSVNILEKMLEDKRRYRNVFGGDLKKLAQKRHVRFVTPL